MLTGLKRKRTLEEVCHFDICVIFFLVKSEFMATIIDSDQAKPIVP